MVAPAVIAAGIGAAGSILGGKGGGGGGAAGMADPFASQRGMYQGILSNLYGGMAGAGGGGVGGGSTTLGGYNEYALARDRALATGDDAFPSYTDWNRGTAPGSIMGGKGARPMGPGAAPEAATGGGSSIMDFITSSPDYQFRLAEGQRALERSASARGMLRSGGLMRDLMSFGQGQAASAYESEINRIMTMAGATVGSPGVAGQIAAQQAAGRQQSTQQALGAVGYGIGQLAQGWGTPATQAGMIQQQTGYAGGVSGVLSGAEWESW